jgi:NADP-dependent alcohol dehydrogenase
LKYTVKKKEEHFMVDFTYYNPTKIEFGKDKERTIGAHIADAGIRKVLLCYGSERIRRDGLFDAVADALKSSGVEVIVLGGIVSNPVMSKVYEGIALARAGSAEAVLGVGGGSVLDSAKAIAAGVPYQGDVWDFFDNKATIEAALPVFAVMTLAATGSEMNGYAVVTNEATKQKYSIASAHVYPRVSVINPMLTSSVPNDYLAYSAADIIAHTIEGYFTAAVQPHFQSRLVESIILTVMETTEILLEHPGDYHTRGEFAWAATQALNGLTTAGTGGYGFPNHMIEHALSAVCNLPHGAGLSIVIPAWMKWYCAKNEAQFQRFAERVFGLLDPQEGIDALKAWFDKVGTPTALAAASIHDAQLQEIIDVAAQNAVAFGMDDVYTREVIADILARAK